MNIALKQEEAAKYLKSEYSAGFDLGTYISMMSYRLLDSLVVECWLRVREVPGSIPSQGPLHTKDVIKMVPVVPCLALNV